MEPAVAERLGGGLRVAVIALHHRIAAQHDLAEMPGVARHLDAGVVVDGRGLHHRHRDPGPRLQGGARLAFHAIPFRLPETFGDMTEGFGEAVDLGDVEAERLDRGERRGRRRCAGGEDLDHVVEGAAFLRLCVDDRIEDDRRAAEMRHPLVGNGSVDVPGGNVAAADERPAEKRDHPGVAPAVAVEERHDGQVHRAQNHAPAHHRAHGHQVGAAVVINDTLRPTRGARRVVERDRFPFVLGQDPWRARIAPGEEVLVFEVPARGGDPRLGVGHLDDLRCGAGHRLDRRFGERQEGRVHQHDLCLPVIEDVAHRIGIEPDVDRVEDRAGGGHAEVRFGLCGDVGQDRRHHVARSHPPQRKCRGEPAYPRMVLRIAAAHTAIDHGRLTGEVVGRAAKMRQGRQRHEVRAVLLQPRFVGQPAHGLLPVSPRR